VDLWCGLPRQQRCAEQAVVTAAVPDMRITWGHHGFDLLKAFAEFQEMRPGGLSPDNGQVVLAIV